MTRIVMVSNRVLDAKCLDQAGGVAVAIADVLRRAPGVWLGWSGRVTAQSDDAPEITRDCAGTVLARLSLSAAEHHNYYLGYANSVLWPVYHNRVDLAQFGEGYFAEYRAVNQRFAQALAPMLEPDDIVWVHDYHFLLLARELRALGVRNKIGLYLHIPFPPNQSCLAIPEHAELAIGYAAFDLVGLQTATDVAHFIDYMEHGMLGQLLPDGRLRVGAREFAVAHFPVGIDPSFYDDIGHEPIAQQPGARCLIGVDRLDYTKGLPQKFRAYEKFLSRYVEHRNRVVLTQIASPTRESVEAYTDIRRELESLSGAINGAYGDLDWVPIHYVHRTAPRRKLAGVLRAARVGLVTPLRDGMNLVAKEFVAAQDASDPGVLVLSRFAGAAAQLDAAVIVNPYNLDEMAEAFNLALVMPLEERRNRNEKLLASVRTETASAWADAFLEALSNTRQPMSQSRQPHLRRVTARLRETAAPPLAQSPL